MTITQFAVESGQLVGTGTLTGTVTNATGTLATLDSTDATIPISSAIGSCSILSLHTGTINLNVLGLVVNLSPINLNITAQAGPGNLLGNLLCSVANLLNGGLPLGSLSTLLNEILALL